MFHIRSLLLGVASAALIAGSALAKDDIVVALQLEPPHLDPTSAAAGAIDSVLYSNVFEGLTRFMGDGSIVPGLAESWEISDDGLTYTFKLHDGVTFHDGTTMDAEDVKFSLDRARAEDSVNAQKALYTGIADVEVIDPLTVKLTLSEPNGSLLFNLAWGDAVIVAPESIENIKQTPIGTGAFKFVNWVQGDKIELERNDAYWGDAPALAKATFKFISDPTAAFAAVMAEDVDVFAGFPAPENLPQFEADPRFQVLIGSTEGETILSINNAQAPFDNVKVREAIAHAIDRQAIIDGAMFGYGTPIGTFFAPHNPAYVDLTGLSEYDPEKSRALLAEAGFADGFETTLHLPPPSYARRGGEIVAAQLAEVGIKAEIINVEWAQWLETVFKGKNFGLTIISHTEPMDIGVYANPDYYFQYDNPDFQALMTKLNGTTDPDMRTQLLGDAQRMISEDYVNGYLFQLAMLSVAKADLQGLWTNAPTQATDLTGVSWAD
ncbi:ABC transporter substrate-binding protein [Pseudosulfitobacter pseudonitzschiae]|uniref:ABC transporter substrate-binding protein n=1 Tax=Pseudosulfitobacter pseudonitzschiae TaxID=1402135 RepID=UPI001AF6849A|nr:ABC transporter substrate-binding protein [Pseudosulfitobacter pseudonitzschiae]MBM1815543.1 ABC transporter substrate-binding protein [Pseudosulfitobacter pseudonitzschiae]MBM1832534.1 ABC transporter substrate-binding protein [Pseudosulfitobacter pseudonitzschiae]MBM1837402.1 ABC transporter substrate-binding protein [Pseudosulfitobacter pseudonitzschiae]MBM1842248.1 ABC transporter substrate-binding protein [Pseudosulfitobacter pseudonitzschiae]MBM1847116.1 ABC transporter substrate-bind